MDYTYDDEFLDSAFNVCMWSKYQCVPQSHSIIYEKDYSYYADQLSIYNLCSWSQIHDCIALIAYCMLKNITLQSSCMTNMLLAWIMFPKTFWGYHTWIAMLLTSNLLSYIFSFKISEDLVLWFEIKQMMWLLAFLVSGQERGRKGHRCDALFYQLQCLQTKRYACVHLCPTSLGYSVVTGNVFYLFFKIFFFTSSCF